MRNRAVRRTLVLSFLWIFMAAVLVRFRDVLLPFGIAVLLAFILEPLVELLSTMRFRGRTVPRVGAIIGIYAVLVCMLSIFGTWTTQQVGRELAGLAKVRQTVVADAKAITGRLLDRVEAFAKSNQLPFDRQQIQEELTERGSLVRAASEFSENAGKLVGIAADIVGNVFTTIFGAFLVLMLTAFLSMDRARIERFFFSLVPPEYQSAYNTVVKGMSIGLAGVVRGQVLICLTNGVLTFIGLWILDVKLPLILASVAAIFSLIPIFGSILSTIPIVGMALTDSFAKGIFALLWIIGIHLVEANFLNPKIMGDAAKIHPVVIVFALIVGERTAGLPGALFAVPIASVIVTFFKFLHARALDVESGFTQDIRVPEPEPVSVRAEERKQQPPSMEAPKPAE
jgi:predicted PurR-regulated permease PerM